MTGRDVPGFTRHPLTVDGAAQMISLAESAARQRRFHVCMLTEGQRPTLQGTLVCHRIGGAIAAAVRGNVLVLTLAHATATLLTDQSV